MKDITLFYDLIFIGGIETSLNDLFYSFKNSKTCNLSLAHIYQYFTQRDTINNLSKNVNKIVDIGSVESYNTDIFVTATMIFPYKEILDKVNSKYKIGWCHAIPTKQISYENIFRYKEYCDQIDYWVCVSEEVKKGLLKLLPNAKCEVIHNTLNEKRIKELASEPVKMKKADITFVTSARLGKEKGFDKAIEFIDKIHKKGINYVWYIIGAGSSKETIDMIKEATKKYNIVCTGYDTNPYKYIARADYGLLFSPLESWCLFYDECHILGVPTITYDLPVFHERENCEKMGLLLNKDFSNFNIDLLEFNLREFKSYLKNYKYPNEYDKWEKLFESLK